MRLRTILLQTLTTALAALTLAAAPAAGAAPADRAEQGLLRGGDRLFAPGNARCSVAFNATDGSRFYGLLPGHCGGRGTRWFADPGLTVPVGETEVSRFPGSDYALVRYTNPDYSYPSEVSAGGQSHRIDRAAQPTVGQRVCQVGSASGHRCGTVQAVNVSVTHPEGVVHGLFRSTLCLEPGDAGAPAFGGNAALGIAVGGSGNCRNGGTTYHQPVAPVLAAHGLRVGY
ncbi:streptogrisin B precursor [Streptomyces sp. p1417]|uniref:Streptogrisin B n=1 Tax=Streptomyces typhae TaxID=2681492 RepID=A0A6L6WVB4_9ACTN|nr:S1 family peptidase [Streptomyces typhae]MVO85677.1 streptogrisin B precursor [Streptomyces typhae]